MRLQRSVIGTRRGTNSIVVGFDDVRDDVFSRIASGSVW